MADPNLIYALQNAKNITALTGAGVSAESGIPTFRAAQKGLWSQYDPMELATPQAFEINPGLVWAWYQWRRNLILNAKPNPAHIALAALEKKHDAFSLITQNVDNLHQKAGSQTVIELHGNIFRTRCVEHNHFVESWEEITDSAPACPICQSYLRPDVVWFNETLPKSAFEQAIERSTNADLFLIIGTSALVQPAASLPLLARSNGATLIEINPQPSALSSNVDILIKGPAGEIVPELISHIFPKTR